MIPEKRKLFFFFFFSSLILFLPFFPVFPHQVSIGVSYHEAMVPGIRQVTGSRPHAPIKPTGSKGNKVPGIAYRHTHPEATETLCPSAHVLERFRGGLRWGLGAIPQTLVDLFGVCLKQQDEQIELGLGLGALNEPYGYSRLCRMYPEPHV